MPRPRRRGPVAPMPAEWAQMDNTARERVQIARGIAYGPHVVTRKATPEEMQHGLAKRAPSGASA